MEFKNFEYQISSSGVGAYWRCLKVACKDSHLGLVASGYAFPKAFNLVSFPYDEVFDSWMGGEEFRWYGIES